MGEPLLDAVQALRRGGLVAYPTDTLFGLAARAGSSASVDRLVRAKARPPGQPISVAVSSTEELEPLVRLSDEARAFARWNLPGPFTLVAAARPGAPLAPSLLAPDGSVGIRVPGHPLARELARRAGPITATSANRHGAANPRSVAAIRRAFGPQIAVYLSGGPAPSGRPSTLVDVTGPAPRVLSRAKPGRRA